MMFVLIFLLFDYLLLVFCVVFYLCLLDLYLFVVDVLQCFWVFFWGEMVLFEEVFLMLLIGIE